MLVKRELVNLSMPFPENVFYDWRIAVIAAVNGGVAYVDEILVYQRVHEQNASFGQHTQAGYQNERQAFQNEVARHSKVFIETPNLNKKDKQFFEKLRNAGILVNLHYIPVYRHPYYEAIGYDKQEFPNAESYYSEAKIEVFHGNRILSYGFQPAAMR
jgi:hypothetical protein